MSATAQGAVIEIVERVKTKDPNGVVVPNEVRINGQALLCSADEPVVVHEVSTLGDDLVYVTLTLIAKRVFVGQEVL